MRYYLNDKPILFISYFSGINGNCPAEWADDNIRVLSSHKIRVFVVTGMQSSVADYATVRYFQIPSFSWSNFKHE